MKPNNDQPKAPESKPDAKDDLKSLPMPELQAKLGSSPDGLSQAEATTRLAQYGLNEIEEKKTNLFLKFLSYFWGPIRRCSKRVDGAEELKVKSRRQGTNG